MNPIRRLVYHSVARSADGLPLGDLGTLLEECLVANPANRITGVLAVHDGRFLQVIEGPADAIGRLYTAIGHDRRHERIELVFDEPCAARAFGAWSMAFAYRDPRLRRVFRYLAAGALPRDAALAIVRELAAIVA